MSINQIKGRGIRSRYTRARAFDKPKQRSN